MAGKHFIRYSIGLVSLLLYYFISYVVQRHETLPLMLTYGILFLFYLLIIQKFSNRSLRMWLVVAVLARVLLIFSVPNLSDDFYRFIWDGRLLNSGYHPFAQIPTYYIDHPLNIKGIDLSLFSKLNSKTYFTVYPPVAQFIFWVAVKCSPGSVYGSLVIMKVFIVLAELGTIFMIIVLLKKYKLPDRNVLLYALNPLVILELSGNAHLESVMIFFIMLSLWLLTQNKVFVSGIFFACAITTKLIPLMFLPVLLAHSGWRKSLTFYAAILATTLVLFLPLLNMDIIKGFQTSLGYYFSRFEFNASIYYVVRQAGYLIFGYNIIQSAGWILGVVSMLLILYYSFHLALDRKVSTMKTFSQNIPTYAKLPLHWMWILLIYFMFVTILHPWYIVTLLALSIFTPYRFAVVWTATIFLTYTGYSQNAFEEHLCLTFLEYLLVSGFLLLELYAWKKKGKSADHLLPES